MNEDTKKLLGMIENAVAGKLGTKFTILPTLADETIKKFQNRKVDDVTEYDESTPLGNYKAWLGSTETEYFSIIFMRGIVTITLEEREMNLGQDVLSYAVLTKLLKISNKPNSPELFTKYYTEGYDEDLKQTTFNDIMVLFKWKFLSKKVKVKEGMRFTWEFT